MPSSRRRLVLLALLACATSELAFGCSLLVDLDGLTHAGPDAGEPDGGAAPYCGDAGGLQQGAPWPTRGRCPTRASWSSVRGPQQPKLRWRTSATRPSLVRRPIIAADGTIYVGDPFGVLYAVAPDGSPKWQFDLGDTPTDSSGSQPTIGVDGTLYVGSITGIFYALNADGTLKWSVSPDAGDIDPSPLVDPQGDIFFGGGRAFVAVAPDGGIRWIAPTGGHDSTAAAAANGDIYVSSFDGKLYALRPSGDVRWTFQTDGATGSTPVVGADGTLYFVASGGLVQALTPAGAFRWGALAPGVGDDSLSLGDGVLYVGCHGNCPPGSGLYAFGAADGSLRWVFPTTAEGMTNPAAIDGDGTIYFGANDGHVYAVGPDGKEKWSYALGGPGFGVALGSDGALYVACKDGHLYAFEP